jgi:hypothetical protein
MRYRSVVALALGLTTTFGIGGAQVFGQLVSQPGYGMAGARPSARGVGRTSPAAYAEEVQEKSAPGRLAPGSHADPFSDDTVPMESFAPMGGYGDGCCDDGACYPGCCGPSEAACLRGQCFFTADYLYVRSSFSEAVKFMEVDNQSPGLNERTINQFDFNHDSSYRVGGGYRLCECGDEIRFMYTNFSSDADDHQDFDTNIIVPYEVVGEPGGEYLFNADVDANVFDLTYAKTIPLGGDCCCSDPCGGCAPCCPAWDITWSGGVRVADVDWRRTYAAFGATDNFVSDAVSTMDFEGAGAKVGLEGRRYFFSGGWLSLYAKGDISVLYGSLDFETVRTEEGGSVPDQIIRQTTSNQQIIPVTEIEAGISGQVSCNGRISAGYLLSAWHDLGYRDEFQLDNVFPLQYDDANILGFDGFFARIEYGF